MNIFSQTSPTPARPKLALSRAVQKDAKAEQVKDARLTSDMENYSEAKIERDIRASIDKFTTSHEAEDLKSAHDALCTRHVVRATHSRLKSAIFQARKDRRAKNGTPVAIRGLTEVKDALTERLAALTAIERAAAEEIQIPYTESPTILALATRLRVITERIEYLKLHPDSCGSPKDELGDWMQFD